MYQSVSGVLRYLSIIVFLFLDRLDGKKKKTKSISEDVPPGKPAVYQRGIPDYDYKIGTLKFIRNSRPSSSKDSKVHGTLW